LLSPSISLRIINERDIWTISIKTTNKITPGSSLHTISHVPNKPFKAVFTAKPEIIAVKKVKNSFVFRCWTSDIKNIILMIQSAVPSAEAIREIDPDLQTCIENLKIEIEIIRIRKSVRFFMNLNKNPARKTMANVTKA
jgi:hypothetical protein